MKKIMCLLLVVAMIFSLNASVFAEEITSIDETMVITKTQGTNEIKSREIAPCPVNGIHYMYSSGWARVYSSDGEFRYNMNAYVCPYCGEMFLCTGWPESGQEIGTYITGVDSEGQQQSAFWIVYTDYSAKYTSKSTMPGYRFLDM